MSKCPICGASAYQGFNSFECSTAGCKNFKVRLPGETSSSVAEQTKLQDNSGIEPSYASRLRCLPPAQYFDRAVSRAILGEDQHTATGREFGKPVVERAVLGEAVDEAKPCPEDEFDTDEVAAKLKSSFFDAQKVADFGGHAGLYGGAAAPGKTEALRQEIYRSFDQTISRAILGAPAEEPTPEDKFDTDEVAAKLKAHFFDAFRTKFNGFAPLQDLDPRAVVGFVSSWFDDRLPQLLEDECCVIDGEDAPLHGVDCECACGECPDPKGPPSDAPKA